MPMKPIINSGIKPRFFFLVINAVGRIIIISSIEPAIMPAMKVVTPKASAKLVGISIKSTSDAYAGFTRKKRENGRKERS